MAAREAEERPTKLRKLDSDDSASADQANTPVPPVLLQADEVAKGSLENPSASNGIPQQLAANLAGTPAERGEDSRKDSDAAAELGKKRRRDPDPAEHERLLLQQQQQNGEPTERLSKSQLKKLRRREEWEANRDHRKAKRKQKIQEKRARKREARDEEAQRLQLLLQQPPQEPKQDEVQHPKSVPKSVHPQVPKPKHPRHIQLPLTILVDCGYDELMMEKERISLGSQITRAYSDNHHAPYQAHLVISSWGGLLKERFDTVLHKHYLNWRGVRFEEGDFVDAAKKMDTIMKDPKIGGQLVGLFDKFAPGHTHGSAAQHEEQKPADTDTGTDAVPPHEATTESLPIADMAIKPEPPRAHPLASENPESAQGDTAQASSDPTAATVPSSVHLSACPRGEIIYLTSDSPNTLSTLSPYSTYIVGGLVDKNRHKGICYKTACDRGIKTAKLPIGEFLEMSSRKVLATNHVVEILLRWMEEATAGGEEGAWGRAFLRVIPKRKGGKLRGQDGDHETEERVDQGGAEENAGDENSEQGDQDGDEENAADENDQREDQDGDEVDKAGAEV
ncbi:tRNA m(1)G methyltransferase domain-containing protein [Cladophialophora carrionii]|uniref:tRNA (guanine(9)-N1)-methyltransferase n=1 Tax=Cladophialophora carrionii TaxID=86049 RepID=A0A1C1CHE4_9EURO|nr:tRNA m(1)G methyltransferase domain-containing protein [Cladophialophora carrionii]